MKKFYNNTKMSGAFSNALRVLALLCVLLGFSSSAWAGYLICGPDAMGLSYNSGKEMTKSGAVYTYTFTATNDAKPAYVKFYNGSISDSNWMGCDEWQPQVNLETNYTCTQNKKTEYKINITKNTTYTITLTAKSESDLSSAVLFVSEHCRPKSSLISATYNVASKKIVLSGSLTETCEDNTYYGFRYRIKGATTWGENDYIEGTYPDKQSHHSTTSIDNFTVSWDEFEAGKTYEFCAYAYQNGFYNSSTKISVTTPVAPTEVLLTKDAVYNEDTKTANLHGYLKQNPVQNGNQPCANLVEYGFVLTEGMGSTPKADDIKLNVGSTTDNLIRGEEFDGSISVGDQGTVIKEDKVYAYRAYVLYGGTYIYSNEIRYFSTGACIPQPGGNGTIYITVDGSRSAANDDDCALIYSSLQTALVKLKANELYTDVATGNLLQAVVINVSQFDNATGETGKGTYVGGTYLENGVIKDGKKYYVSGGDADGVDGQSYARKLRVLAIEGFNNNTSADTYDAEHTLTIQANNGDSPRIEHILIRRSRNVILKGLNIFSNGDGTTKDTALEIDNGEYRDWDNVKESDIKQDANILVKDCVIGSNGFTGVHVNSYGGMIFENNTFNLDVPDADSNTKNYGSSVKFYQCKDIKFIRNNFWGAHTTLLWLQQTRNALFYNNIFWNTNTNTGTSSQSVRIYDQYSSADYQTSDNIAVLYNTFYIADGAGTANEHHSFIYINDFYVSGNIYFQYNNCYCYDADMNAHRSNDISQYKEENRKKLCPNNYWSVYDKKQENSSSVFAPAAGCSDGKFIDVSALICETTASGPASLVIKQPVDQNGVPAGGLYVGTPLTIDGISTMSGGILLTEEELKSDRYRQGVRKGSNWTLGALEGTTENYVDVIYWLGGDSKDWDNRNNWAYIIEEGLNTRASNQRTLTCVDILSPNLKIVIPQKGSQNYPTTTKATYYYPEIPVSFDATNREKSGIPAEEQVSAGVGVPNASIEKYASSIELEYGAALKGVHRLWDQSANKFRYDEGITSMTLDRDQWTLVGPVVLPWKDDTKTETREVESGDYFLDYEPNVYMHEAVIGEGPSLTWNKSFASLSTPVPANSAFAVSIPNSYGNFMGIGFPADVYYTQLAPDKSADHPMINDVTVPKTFKPFEGRFVNDNALITYSGLTPGQAVLLNNSYPCNISVEELQKFGTVYLYDYLAKSIKLASDEFTYKGYDGKIKPQNGFVFIPNSETESVTITEDMLVDGDTKSRSLEVEKNKIAINLHAGSSNSLVHSTISIEHDPELGVGMESEINAPKVFAYREAPELYMMAHDKTLCRLAVPKSETIIPLGIQVKTPMYVTFNMVHNSGFSKVTLVDTENDYEHDLLESPYTADILPKGTCEGRYYLNIVSDASDYGDDDVTTSVEDAAGEDLAINIYNDTDNSDAITVVTSNVELEKIYVSDSMGRVIPFEAKGNYAKIQIPNAMGVYIIQVIGDKASRTEKVILK